MTATPRPIRTIGTSDRAVELTNDAGWSMALPWEDAIHCAQTILVAADARGLLPDPPLGDLANEMAAGRVRRGRAT
jgi:hypothetical protein